MQLIDSIFRDLRKIINSITVKYENKARQFETVDSKRESDLYLYAAQKMDSFNTYQRFDLQAIINAGVSDIDLAIKYVNDKYLIPRSLRDRVVEEQRKIIVDSYVEKNNYYRMLNGKPDIEDINFIYVDTDICIELGLNPNTPIHEYTNEEISLLESNGYLKPIIEANPTKKYLNYLGKNAISIVFARSAKNFTILRMTNDIPDAFNEDFNTTYNQCREYYMSVIYNRNFGKQYEYYDNFIAMMIMVMTIQRLISNTFKYGIEYDFYDLASIKMIFDAYRVPFIQNLPIDYQRILIRNLNTLLRYKGTDKVLYDICSLLGLDNIKIYKYFLFKEHRFDDQGNPIFATKEIVTEDGVKIVPDYETMYKLFFQSVELRERNLALALSDNTNILDYTQVVIEDPYWWDEDDELKKTIYESEFNFIESKYLSMNVMYKLTEMLFEISYIFNMLIDKKDELNTVTIKLPRMFEDKDINLFDITVLLCALIAKKTNMAGNIIHTPSKTLTVMGFNFNLDFRIIRNEIRNNKYLDHSEINKYLENLTISTPADVNRIYANIRDLNDFLVEKLSSVQTIEEYHAYRKLYDTLMVTQHMENLFRKSDGEVAETFIEYLWDRDHMMAQFVEEVETDLIGEYVEHILFRLNQLVTDLKYLHIINESNSLLLNAAVTLIRFFKSYTTDLTSFNILYLLDSRYFNMIRVIGKIKSMTKTFAQTDTGLIMKYADSVKVGVGLSEKDFLELLDFIHMTSNIKLSDQQLLEDGLDGIEVRSQFKNLLKLNDNIGLFVTMFLKDILSPYERQEFLCTILHKDPMTFFDIIKSMNVGFTLKDSTLKVLNDDLHSLSVENKFSEDLDVTDKYKFSESFTLKDKDFNIYDKLKSSTSDFLFKDESIKVIADELYQIITNDEFRDILSFYEKQGFSATFTSKDKSFNTHDKLKSITTYKKLIDDFTFRYKSIIHSLNKQILNKTQLNMRDKIIIQREI